MEQEGEKETLRECPFCGGELHLESYRGSAYVNVKGHQKWCFLYHCTYNSSVNGCATYIQDVESFMKRWNKRVFDDADD